jgi:outer membrane protein assembly factor BamB
MTFRRRLSSPWAPAFVLAAAAIPLLAWWSRDEVPDVQQRNYRTLAVALVAVLLLLVWTFFLSPLSRRVRAGLLAALLLLPAALRIDGVSGDLVPLLRWRWTSAPAPEAAASTAADRAGEFPRFLGARGDAVVEGVALDPDWTRRPPRIVWRRAVGPAWSGFAVAGGVAVTQEQHGDRETVAAYDLATGRPLWTHSDAARYDTAVGGEGPRATPTISGNRVLTFGATGILNALDRATGRRLWTAPPDGPPLPWGSSSSPLVVGGRVFVQGPAAGLSAFDLESGRRLWTSTSEKPSYASPAALTLFGTTQVVMPNQFSCTGHDPESGEVLWRHAWRGEHPKVAPPVRFGERSLAISAGYGVGLDRFDLFRAGSGVWIVKPLGTSMRLKSKFAAFVAKGNHLFGLDDGRLVCVRTADGERAWVGDRYGHGQLLLCGEFLLVTTEGGAIVLVDADPEAFRERARFDVFADKQWNPPALAGRLLLLRTSREAACLELPRR